MNRQNMGRMTSSALPSGCAATEEANTGWRRMESSCEACVEKHYLHRLKTTWWCCAFEYCIYF